MGQLLGMVMGTIGGGFITYFGYTSTGSLLSLIVTIPLALIWGGLMAYLFSKELS